MPTLAVARDYLFRLIGKTYTEKQFEDLCFEFGVELDDVTSEKEMFVREQGLKEGATAATGAAAAAAPSAVPKNLSEEVIYKIDTPANRYDLLSAEGMSLALKVFLGFIPAPKYRVLNQANPAFRMLVDRSVGNVRDYVVCAVLRNVTFTAESYNSFIDFQEKLHSGLARKRTLASVGTHDLDKLNGCTEFRYTATPKENLQFVPLNQTKKLDCSGDGLAQYYKDDRHISKFIPLISSLPKYRSIFDNNGNLLSLPPIINSDFSKISQSTKNIFIECTAPDHYKASVLVNQIVCAFSSYCADPFTVEAVKVEYEGADASSTRVVITPQMDVREMKVDVTTVNRRVGIELTSSDACAALLNKMFLYATPVDANTVSVGIPPCRSDILHQCDLIEDVAIAHGYDNIVLTETPTHSNGSQAPVNKLSHLLRLEIVGAGYLEALTFSLCARDEAFKFLGREDKDTAVHVANPQTVEFQICRPTLMAGMLKTFQASKSQPLPLKLFEVSDVVLLDNETNFPAGLNAPGATTLYSKTGARNERHVAALHCTTDSSGFEDIHGLVEFIMMKLGVPQIRGTDAIVEADEDAYYFREGQDAAYFPGRAMDIFLRRKGQDYRVGSLGVVHPNTLKAFELPFPCAFCEVNIQPFV